MPVQSSKVVFDGKRPVVSATLVWNEEESIGGEIGSLSKNMSTLLSSLEFSKEVFIQEDENNVQCLFFMSIRTPVSSNSVQFFLAILISRRRGKSLIKGFLSSKVYSLIGNDRILPDPLMLPTVYGSSIPYKLLEFNDQVPDGQSFRCPFAERKRQCFGEPFLHSNVHVSKPIDCSFLYKRITVIVPMQK